MCDTKPKSLFDHDSKFQTLLPGSFPRVNFSSANIKKNKKRAIKNLIILDFFIYKCHKEIYF